MLDEPDIPQAESSDKQLFDDVVLSAHCMARNRPIDEFCHDCGMPIGQYVWNQPLQGVLAQGWAYRRASTGRVSPIIFWGMWAMFSLPLFAVLVVSLGELIMHGGLILRLSIKPADVSVRCSASLLRCLR